MTCTIILDIVTKINIPILWLMIFALTIYLVSTKKLFKHQLTEELRSLPSLPVVQPSKNDMLLFGTAIAFRKDPIGFLNKQREIYGDAFTLNLVNTKMHFFISPAYQLAFFRLDDKFSLDQAFYDRCPPFKIQGMTDKYSKLFLKLTATALNQPKMLHAYHPLMTDVVSATIMEFTQSGTLDVFELTSSIAVKIAIVWILGKQFYKAHADDMVQLILQIEKDIASPLNSFFPGWPHPPCIRMQKAIETMFKWVSHEIKLRRMVNANAPVQCDLLQLLLNCHECNVLLEADISRFMLTLFLAAHTNTAANMGWTIYELAKHTHLQQRVRAEVVPTQTTESLDSDSTFTDFYPSSGTRNLESHMPITTACIKETGRLYMKLLLLRKSLCDAQFGGYKILKGELICISPGCVALDSKLFEYPNVYNPDRWLPNNHKSTTSKPKIIPPMNMPQFGIGKHHCLGERVVLMAIKTIVLPELLRRFECTLDSNEQIVIPDYFGSISSPFPKHPIRIKVVPI
ncbi:hypothetical protein RTP6_006818 [Batrachochytrium dendrobatidis]